MEQKMLGKIILHMKQRHLRNENFPISLEEILEEIHETDCLTKIKNMLDTTTLVNNPKLESTFEQNVRKYTFKPIYNIKNRRELISLVKEQQSRAAGGILLEDIQESLPNADDVIKKIGDELFIIMGKGKKKVVYYNDKSLPEINLQVEEDIVKYWREVAVDGLSETQIEDYLEKQGIQSMKNNQSDKKQVENKKTKSRQGRQSKKHNVHVELNEYNPDLVKEPLKK